MGQKNNILPNYAKNDRAVSLTLKNEIERVLVKQQLIAKKFINSTN